MLNPNPSNNVTRRVSKSAVLAGAALGLPLAAHADIVYTPLNITVSTDNSTDASQDLQIGGVNEFLFTASLASYNDTVTPLGSNGYVGTLGGIDTPPYIATPLTAGTTIGSTSGFLTPTGSLAYNPKFFQKNWPKTGIAYLGIEFYVGGLDPADLHYGWVSLSACVPGDTPCSDPSAVIQITGLGYNDVAGQSINAGQGAVPEPSTLPLLALGAAGIAAFRARRKKAA